MKRRILSVLLATVMLFSTAVSAFASQTLKYDINGDGYENAKDALDLLKRYLAGTTTASEDINGDGFVNAKDSLEIMKYIMNKPVSNTSSNFEAEVVRLVNIEREKNGLSPLEQDRTICKAADIRAEEINKLFSHTRPNGSSCFTVLQELDVEYVYAGENIAAGYRTPAAVVEGWMNSSGHRANILDGRFRRIGVGFNNYGWVQLFTT